MLTPMHADNIRPFHSLAIGEHFTVNPGTSSQTQRTFEKVDPVQVQNKLHRYTSANARDVVSGAYVQFQNAHMVTVVSRYP